MQPKQVWGSEPFFFAGEVSRESYNVQCIEYPHAGEFPVSNNDRFVIRDAKYRLMMCFLCEENKRFK